MDNTVSVQDRLNILMQGGQTETQRTEFLDGAPDQIAGELIKHLKNEGIVGN